MDERDLQPEQPGARRLVDQLHARRAQAVEVRLDAPHLVRDVVHALAAAVEEPPDGRVGPGRREQLDQRSGADAQRDRADALLGHDGLVVDLAADQDGVPLDGSLEVADGDPDMVDPEGARHGWS